MIAQFRKTSPDQIETRSGKMPVGAPKARKAWDGGEEPSIAELLDDPAMRRLLARDRIDPDALLGLMADIRERLTAGA